MGRLTNQQTNDGITHTNTLVRANLPQRAKTKTRKTGIDTGGPESSHRLPVVRRNTKVVLEMTPAALGVPVAFPSHIVIHK